MNNKKLAERISAEISRKGIMKKDLAERINTSDAMVSYWCSGKRVPLVHQLVAMAQFFGVSTDYLLGLSDSPNRRPSLVDELNLSDMAIANLSYISVSPDARGVLNKLLENQGFYSSLANLAQVQKLYDKTIGHFHSIDLPDEIKSEVYSRGYEILTDQETVDYREKQTLDDISEMLKINRRG